jgi:hypothetical protein
VTVLLVAAPIVGVCADMFSGTWKTNLEKSTYSPGPPPTGPNIAKFESVNNGIHVVLDSVNATGRKSHVEYTVYFDGKEVPVTSTLDGQLSPTAATIRHRSAAPCRPVRWDVQKASPCCPLCRIMLPVWQNRPVWGQS